MASIILGTAIVVAAAVVLGAILFMAIRELDRQSAAFEDRLARRRN